MSNPFPGCAQGFDLVIHTAGPFQWKLTSSVLEAAIAAKVPYIDVADDADFSAVRALTLCPDSAHTALVAAGQTSHEVSTDRRVRYFVPPVASAYW